MRKVLRMFLPGRFEDAQLYMGHLVIFGVDRDAKVVELEGLTDSLETRYPQWNGILTAAFARNDYLGSGVTKSLSRNSLVADALNSAFDELARTPLDLDSGDSNLLPLEEFKQEDDVILDTVMYAKRLYMGTTAGFYDYDIDWANLLVKRCRKRLDARCVVATAEYGAVNVSCEDEGLFTGYDDFGWRDTTADTPALTKTAPKSVRSAWYGTDLVNYEGPAMPKLLSGSVESVATREDGTHDRSKKVVTQFSEPTNDLNRLTSDLARLRAVPPDGVQFVWNSSRAFFINTYSHGFFSAVERGPEREVKFTRHGITDGRVVAVHRFAAGWVIETDFSTYCLSGGKLVELLKGEPLSVRAFEGSKRYRRIVAITVETGVHLISVVDGF